MGLLLLTIGDGGPFPAVWLPPQLIVPPCCSAGPCGWVTPRTQFAGERAHTRSFSPGLRIHRWPRPSAGSCHRWHRARFPGPLIPAGCGGDGSWVQQAGCPSTAQVAQAPVSQGSPLPMGSCMGAEVGEAAGQSCKCARVGRKRSGRRGRPRGEKSRVTVTLWRETL